MEDEHPTAIQAAYRSRKLSSRLLFGAPILSGVELKYATSSPLNDRMRVCVPPSKFGKVFPSTLTVSTWVDSTIV
jgi:hypothetical protein